MMDTLTVISVLLCSTLILFSKVDKFIVDEKYYGLYGAIWLFAISIPICAGIAWIAGG